MPPPTKDGDFVIYPVGRLAVQQFQVMPVLRDGDLPSDQFSGPMFIDPAAAASNAFQFIASVGAGAVWLWEPKKNTWDRVHWSAARRRAHHSGDVIPAQPGDDDAGQRWIDRMRRHLHGLVNDTLKASGRTGELDVTGTDRSLNVAPGGRARELGVLGFLGVAFGPGQRHFIIAELEAQPGGQMRHTTIDFDVVDGEIVLEDFREFTPEQFGNLLWATFEASRRTV